MDADTFLRAIFDQCQGVVVTCNARFITRRWKPGDKIPDDHVYFCISTVKDPNPRQLIRLSRKAQDLVLTYVVVLDDVGTKVSRETLEGLLAPTYKLLTSQPGGVDNEQWGWVFEEGIEPSDAAALVEALATKGLTDKGSKRADRVMRFPGSLNRKYDPPFAARLLEWEPTRLYTYVEVCRGLDVTPTNVPAFGGEFPQLPDGMVDPVVAILAEEGLILGPPNSSGWIPITCPLEHEHTGEIDHGTDYKPGMPGVFKCLHSHGDKLSTSWFRDWLRERRPDADLALIPSVALKAIGKKLAGVLQPVSVPGGRMVAGEEKSLVEAILGDVIHVASESCFWSVGGRCWMDAKALDNRLYPPMAAAGLLDRPKRVPMRPHEWLMQHPDMVRVARVTHRLGKPLIVDDCLNMAPLLPLPVEYQGEPGPWLELISFICKGNQDDVEWLLDWMALVVGDFDEKPGWHLILKGRSGTGKNLAVLPIRTYLQPDHEALVSTAMIGGQFNAFLTKRLLVINELKMTTRGAATAHDIYNNLKAWTARDADTITINEKNRVHFQAADRSCWIITSNEDVPLPLEDDDRRFMVIETPRRRMPDEFYQRIVDWLADGGQSQVIGYLQQRWREMGAAERQALRERAPMTEAKRDLLDDGAEGIQGAIRLSISGKHGPAWPDLMKLEDVVEKLKLNADSLLSAAAVKMITTPRVAAALRSNGAVRLFGGKRIRDAERDKLRLWCVRPLEAERYERMKQGKALADEYASQRNGRIPEALSNLIPFKAPSK
jgi:hypothetical protein